MDLDPSFSSQEVLTIGWIDIHTHLNFLDVPEKEAVDEAMGKGVQKFITIGTETKGRLHGRRRPGQDRASGSSGC